MKLNASKTKTLIVSRSRTMHPQSNTLTISGNVVKESDNLVKLDVTFDSNMSLRSFFSQFSEQHLKDLVSSGSPGALSMVGCCSGDAFGVLSCPFLDYCSAVGELVFLAGGLFECDNTHRRSVAVLCMLYNHVLADALSFWCSTWAVYVPVRVTRGAFFAHRYTYVLLRCRISQYRWTFISSSVSLWNDLSVGFKTKANAFLLS